MGVCVSAGCLSHLLPAPAPASHPCSTASLLLQAYLAFGDEAYLRMFTRLYAAAMTHLQLDASWNGHVW